MSRKENVLQSLETAIKQKENYDQSTLAMSASFRFCYFAKITLTIFFYISIFL